MLHPGEHEPAKTVVHVTVGLLSILCLSYNLAAWWLRRERHLGVNVLVYGGLAIYEGFQVRRHLQRSDGGNGGCAQ